tara:strand:+ start:846 stop:1088 length:243 start_codon:yes stop_codon:yes gene_type:complete
MDSLSYENMMSAHTNPGLPGEGLGGLGRTADVKPGLLIPGLILAGATSYYAYTSTSGDAMDYAALFGAWVAGGLLTQSIK